MSEKKWLLEYRRDTPIEIKVVSETKCYVRYIQPDEHHLAFLFPPHRISKERVFDTFKEVKAALIDLVKYNINALEHELQREQARLNKIIALTEPQEEP